MKKNLKKHKLTITVAIITIAIAIWQAYAFTQNEELSRLQYANLLKAEETLNRANSANQQFISATISLQNLTAKYLFSEYYFNWTYTKSQVLDLLNESQKYVEEGNNLLHEQRTLAIELEQNLSKENNLNKWVNIVNRISIILPLIGLFAFVLVASDNNNKKSNRKKK